mmetsp:Transcript_125746/g.367456  ORF Transcript_125746/g.367456 Transcript_125746/m.367456 type:complete len:394 (-) Transcript_125746:75-1256(-)
MSLALPLHLWLCVFNLVMGFTITVYLYEAFVYNVIFLGRILPSLGRGSLTLPFSIAFNLFWCLAFWSHVQAHLADPGSVPKQWQDFVDSLGAAIPIAPSRQEFQPGKATLCKRCNKSRPERAHHCQFCGICVLRYDHHCPWVSNCVGFNNHKFFLLTVIYGCLAGIVALVTAIPELVYCAKAAAMLQEDDRLEDIATPTLVAFLVFGLVAFLAAALLTTLLTTYLPFAAKNLTTVEEAYTNMANPFDLGGARANLEQIFGVFGPDWFIPVKPFKPQTDGVFFPRAVERVGPGVLELRDCRSAEDSLEAPLAAGEAACRTVSRGSAMGGRGDFSCQDWTMAAEDDVAAERLWRLRYDIGGRGTTRTSSSARTAQVNKHLRFSCCTRPSSEVEAF